MKVVPQKRKTKLRSFISRKQWCLLNIGSSMALVLSLARATTKQTGIWINSKRTNHRDAWQRITTTATKQEKKSQTATKHLQKYQNDKCTTKHTLKTTVWAHIHCTYACNLHTSSDGLAWRQGRASSKWLQCSACNTSPLILLQYECIAWKNDEKRKGKGELKRKEESKRR